MREFISVMRDTISAKNENLRERMFCIINLLAFGMVVLGLIETLPIVSECIPVVCCLVIAVINMSICFYLLLKHHLLDIASVILGFTLCGVVFPSMFRFSGGIEGGATVYFSLNIIYTCIVFRGKWLAFFLALDIISDVVTYAVAYYYPDTVTSLPSREAVFMDSIYSVIVVGIAVGVMLKAYVNAYANQQLKVEEQNKKLEEAGKSKDHFFASMSHEIRTPINTIIGLNEMIMRNNSDEKTLEYAENVHKAGKLLLSLVNDILDLSQMEMGKMEILPVEYKITELISDLVDIVQIQAHDKNLEFNLDIDKDIPCELLGDKKRIEQVMINLLTNAVKYTREGSVTLSVYVESKTKTEVTIKFSVIDTGIGIRKEDITSLYEIFKRVDTKNNEKIVGSGLGLAITKQLVELMGGNLTVDSIYMHGSTFTVSLKQGIINPNRIGYIEHPDKNYKVIRGMYKHLFEAPEARVLIVDDNKMNIVVASELLSATRVQIDTALSGKECLECTRNKYYNIILLDHMMPEMDGIETVKEIRRQVNGLCRDTVIVAMTANAMSGALQYYSENGFDEYIEKPINGELLEKCILSYLPSDIVEYRRIEEGVENLLSVPTEKSRKKKVRITTDCVADLPDDIIMQYDIGVMYLYIRTDKGRFADTIEISSDNLDQFISDEKSYARADSVSVEEYEQFFAEQLTKAEEIIHISMASDSGKSYSIAVEAAESFGHVHVIDSKHISCGQTLLVMYASKLLNENLSIADLIKEIKWAREKIVCQFMLPSIDIFYQNGYANKLIMRFFKTFNLHPILRIKHSSVKPISFCSGELHQARKRFVRRVLFKKRRIHRNMVFISHVALNINDQKMITDEISKYVLFDNVYVNKTSFSCAVNSGMGSIGIAYYCN